MEAIRAGKVHYDFVEIIFVLADVGGGVNLLKMQRISRREVHGLYGLDKKNKLSLRP